MTQLQAYHNKKSIKLKYVNRMKDHIKADELIHGVGFENGKGCAVGCTLNRYDHSCYQNELGLPQWLAHLEDSIFEGMSKEKSKTFPLELLESIPIGVNLDKTYHKMQIFILELGKENVKADYDYVIKAIDGVIDYRLKCATDFFKSESAARSAARSAAYDKMADKLIILLKESKND